MEADTSLMQQGIENAALIQEGYTGELTSVSYQPPESLSFDQYQYELGTTIGWQRIVNWVIGDLIRFGEDKWPDRYTQAIELTGKSDQHLYNVVWVSKVWKPEHRRADVSWSHHLELSGIRDENQRLYWINRAAEEGWTREELRNARKQIKEHEALDKPTVVIPDDTHHNIRAAIADFVSILAVQVPKTTQEIELETDWGKIEVVLRLNHEA